MTRAGDGGRAGGEVLGMEDGCGKRKGFLRDLGVFKGWTGRIPQYQNGLPAIPQKKGFSGNLGTPKNPHKNVIKIELKWTRADLGSPP